MSDTKKCSKCGEVKGLEDFGKRRDSVDGRRHQCIVCHGAAKAAWWAENKPPAHPVVKMTDEERRKRQKSWRDANAAQRRAKREEWRRNNPERYREHQNGHAARLTDRYVKRLIAQESAATYRSITPELIALKREQLAIKRMARELKKAATKPTGENE